jgi:hypothetical protein
MEFSDKNAAIQVIEEAIVDKQEPRETDRLLAKELANLCEQTADPTGSHLRLGLVFGIWIIRDDDLELFKVVRDAAITLASANAIAHHLPAATILSLLLGAAALVRNTIRGVGRLSEDQLLVVMILRKRGGLASAKELLADLQEVDRREWTETRMHLALAGLEKLPTRKDVVSIVKSDSLGRWTLVGV